VRTISQLWHRAMKRTLGIVAVGFLSAALTVTIGGQLLADDNNSSSAVSGVTAAKSSKPAQEGGGSSSRSSSGDRGDAPAKPPATAGDALRFDQPVPFGTKPVRGQTLEQLANGEPLFPPIEGLPENLWKKNCATCHKWDKARLCEQGASYVKSAKGAFRHQHPYGGPYKLALMRWASSGCK
jgi:hypothetical protein